LRDIWDKAELPLSESALLATRNLKLTQVSDAVVALENLKAMWETGEQGGARFSDLEAALVRLGKNYCRKKRCLVCPMKEECQGH